MLLTFILPHYNLPRELLQRCLASIVALEIPAEDYEIVIADDGSDAPPEWVAEEFPQASVKLIKAAHGGPGAARNRGLEAAQGEYIQFVDADDSLIPDAFSACMKILVDERPDILQHGYRVCTTEEQVKEGAVVSEKYRLYMNAAEYLSHKNLSGSPCVYIFRKELSRTNNIQFAEGVMHEDEDFNMKIYYYGSKLIVTRNVAYNYCLRKGSITSATDIWHEARRINHLFKLLERVVAFRFEQQEYCTAVQRAAVDRKLAMLTVDTLLNLFHDGWNVNEVQSVCRGELYSLGLYPLPQRNYSLKYRVFATLSNSLAGLKILRMILPAQKPQKQ